MHNYAYENNFSSSIPETSLAEDTIVPTASRCKQFFIIKNDIHIDVGASIIDIKCRENKTGGNSLFYY